MIDVPHAHVSLPVTPLSQVPIAFFCIIMRAVKPVVYLLNANSDSGPLLIRLSRAIQPVIRRQIGFSRHYSLSLSVC